MFVEINKGPSEPTKETKAPGDSCAFTLRLKPGSFVKYRVSFTSGWNSSAKLKLWHRSDHHFRE